MNDARICVSDVGGHHQNRNPNFNIRMHTTSTKRKLEWTLRPKSTSNDFRNGPRSPSIHDQRNPRMGHPETLWVANGCTV
jgi:hypothetical protein